MFSLLIMCAGTFLTTRFSKMTKAAQPQNESKLAKPEKHREPNNEEHEEAPVRVWPRMRFTPPQPFFLPERFNGSDDDHPTGLANWLLIGYNKLAIKRVRVIFIGRTKDGKDIEWASDDPIVTNAFSDAFVGVGIRRMGFSDFEESRIIASDSSFAMIFLNLDKGDDVIIGASGSGFYFGGEHGSMLQVFESWMMAKLLEDILTKHAAEGLTSVEFIALSGERNIEEQKHLYYEMFPKKVIP